MLKLRKILIMSLLLVPLSIGYTQSDSDDEENPITDPVLLEKLKQIDTMEKLLEITKSDSITTGAMNVEREKKEERISYKTLNQAQTYIETIRDTTKTVKPTT